MAEDKKKNAKDPKINISTLDKVRGLTSGFIYGTDDSFKQANMEDIQSIRSTISKINQNYRQTTGDDIIEFFNRAQSEEVKSKAKSDNQKDDGKKKKKKLINVNDMLENPKNNIINDILFMEAERISLYENFQMIYDHIPQMAQALNTFVDNILSPDDFTKNVFNLYYDKASISDEDDEDNEVIRNLKHINETYKMEDRSTRIIRDTLKLGEQFVAILPLEKEFKEMLKKDSSNPNRIFGNSTNDSFLSENHILSESMINIDDEDVDILNETFGLENDEEKDSTFWTKEVFRMINENIEIVPDSRFLAEDSYIYNEDFTTRSADIPNYEKNKQQEKSDADEKEANDKFKLNGSAIKILDPRRIIKLSVDETNYGYYYVEKVNDAGFGQAMSKTRQDQNNSFTSSVNMDQVNQNMKQEYISKVFIKNIAKKMDKKFIMQNKDFKNVIYNLVKQGYITDKKVKITYLSPDEVEHFRINEEDDHYGSSIFKPILFTAKLYLAVLTSTLMQKLVRSPEKRVFYIETGLDQDTEGVIQGFVKDMKTKELKMNDLKDINTVLNVVGQFHDLYIPVVNGEKPVEIETQPGMDVNLDGDFLEYLRKTMMSGIGVPATFLNYAEEVEFMRSLAMQNGKFVRQIITFQKRFGHHFSELYRKIYKNEFKYKDGSNDKQVSEQTVDLKKIEVKFPSPSSLNMTNMAEQINSSRDIVEYIVTTILGEETDMKKKKYAVRAVTKDLVPSIDWERYEELIKHSTLDRVADELKENSGGSSSDSGDDATPDDGTGGF